MESRRCANYEHSVWDDAYIQSLTTPYTAKEYAVKASDLITQVKIIIDTVQLHHPLDQLDLIDTLKRLDISHHFYDQLNKLLDNIYQTCESDKDDVYATKDLYFTSLQFRILRQHGYHVSQDVFCSFMDQAGSFKSCLADDVRGLLCLYEASFLSLEDETVMDLAKDFSTRNLKLILEDETTDIAVAGEIRHALELPVHWRVQKLEAIWFMRVYASRLDANTVLLRLSELEFNIVQAKYQEEIKHLSRGYEETGLPEKLGFARHRLAECFLWALGFIPEEHLGYTRKIACKFGLLITIIDDIYDIYGTMDELEAFTNAIQRWDINSLDSLPEYLRICFFTLFNSVNEMAYDILRDQGINIISNLRDLWVELSRTYNLEARWYHTAYHPSFNEYLDNAWISISGPLLQYYVYFSMTNPIKDDELRLIEPYPGIIRWPSTVLRLTDDLATSPREMERGDVPKSVQCYMKETGCNEEEAREYIKLLIDTMWKRMNKEIVMEKGMGVKREFRASATNLAKIAHCMYGFGDGYGHPHCRTRQVLASIIEEPITLP